MFLKRENPCNWILGQRRWSCWDQPSWKTCCIWKSCHLPGPFCLLAVGAEQSWAHWQQLTMKSTKFMPWEPVSLTHLDKFLKAGSWAVKHSLLTYHWPAHLPYFLFIFYVCLSICKTSSFAKLSEIHAQKVLLKNWVVLSATWLFFFPKAWVRLEVWVCVLKLYYWFVFLTTSTCNQVLLPAALHGWSLGNVGSCLLLNA